MFLKDEENYAYKNVLDRSLFFMCDSSERPQYNLSKNDKNLKLARLIFRFKRNMDEKFQSKPAPVVITPDVNFGTSLF
jgi:hypothetical protein